MPDWHREWHTRPDQAKIFQGTAGMACPFCEAVVMHSGWLTPLISAPAGNQLPMVSKDAIQAAYWASVNAGKPLAEYLQTTEGKPFAHIWDAAAVRSADQHVTNNPM